MTKRRIAILMHERDGEHTLPRCLITHLASYWREDGHEVVFLFGTETFVPADVVIVHVDLSVVPEPYLAFARRYPAALNGRVRDIRKSTIGSGLLRRDAAWEGPVIVKSDNNYAGQPERVKQPRVVRGLRRVAGMLPLGPKSFFSGLSHPTDYPVYEHLSLVPPHYFDEPGVVVQQFRPEMENGMYCVRIMNFLGDRVTCMRLKGAHPIVHGGTSHVVERIEPHPDMLALRKRLHFDYGKFDYVVVDGEAILLDANKTVGCSPKLLHNEEMETLRRYRAAGLYALFP